MLITVSLRTSCFKGTNRPIRLRLRAANCPGYLAQERYGNFTIILFKSIKKGHRQPVAFFLLMKSLFSCK